MLRICKKNEIKEYIDFAYELALDFEKSGYPTYRDGIKTKDMFVKQLEDSFEDDTEEILLFEQDGKVEGLIQYYWIPEDNYIGTEVFNINTKTDQALSEFLEYLGKKFKGYDLFIGFPGENKSAIDFLSEHGLECIENDYNNTAFLEKLNDLPESKRLIRITKDNYELFKILHDQIEGDMYWNSERILNDLDRWTIFVHEKDGNPQGAIYYVDASDDWFEIFGVDMNHGKFDKDIFKSLLYACLSDVKNKGGHIITFFCDEEGEAETLECGFECVGKYLCYKKHFE